MALLLAQNDGAVMVGPERAPRLETARLAA